MLGKPEHLTFQQLTDRIESNVERIPFSGCWLWSKQLTDKGYARTTFGHGINRYVHRVVYEHFNGPIPDGLSLDHTCRITFCVNPAHLEPVTHRENVLRGIGPTSENSKKSHCKRGHPFAGDNLGEQYLGAGRLCIACSRATKLRWYFKNRTVKAPRKWPL